jgi:hypothetical protein
VKANGQKLAATKWSCTPQAGDVDTTHFESTAVVGGETILFDEGSTGKLSCDIDIEAWWNQEDNPTASPISIRPGQILGPVECHINRTTGFGFYFPQIRVLTMPVMHEVNGKVSYSFKAKSHGPFYFPGQRVLSKS